MRETTPMTEREGPELRSPEGTPVETTTAQARKEDRTKSLAVYVLHLLNFVTGFTAIVGVILAYAFKGEADPVTRSHYDNAIGVFWKGLLYGVVGGFLTLFLIGWLVLLVVAIWFVVRCVKGLLLLNEGKPYPNPGSWGF